MKLYLSLMILVIFFLLSVIPQQARIITQDDLNC